MPQAEPDRVIKEIEEIIGIEAQDALRVSAKNGLGIDDLLEEIIADIPATTRRSQCTITSLDY